MELRDTLIEEMVEDIVVRGSDDWVMLTELDWVVKSNAARHGLDLDVPARITTGSEVVRKVIERGLMRPGTVLPSGFVPWELDQVATIERMESGWRQAATDLKMGDVGWLENTPSGDEQAERVRKEVNARAGWPPKKDASL